MTAPKSLKALLIETAAGQQVLPLTGKLQRPTVKGARYRVLASKGEQEVLADDVIATREGQHLHLRYADGAEVVLEGYYNDSTPASLTLPGNGGDYTLSPSSAGAALPATDGATHQLLYAHGHSDSLFAMAQGQAGQTEVLAQQIQATQHSTGVWLPQSAHGWAIPFDQGLALSGIVLGAAALSGGASGPLDSTVIASVVGGPILEGNDLMATIYKADGITELGSGTINANGTVTVQIKSDYTGVVVVRVQNDGGPTDANGTPDYMDEATGAGKDLGNAVLYCAGTITQAGNTIYLNVNILTTLAYHKAKEAVGDGAPLTNAVVNDANTAIAKAFGLPDLTGGAIQTVVTTTGAQQSSNTYGDLLAALSGADQTQTTLGDTQATIDRLVAGITINAGAATLDEDALNTLVAGAALTDPDNSLNLVDSVSDATSVVSASISINDVAADNIINASEKGSTLSGSNVAGAAVTLNIGGNTRTATVSGTTWSYALTDADIAAIGQGADSLRATATLGSTSAQATRNIFVDTAAPVLSLSSPAHTNDTTPTVSGNTEPGLDVTVSIAGATYTVTANSNGAWSVDTGTATPTSGTLAINANGSNAVTATATDKAGNSSTPATQTLVIDTTAPTLAITSAALSNDATPTVSGSTEPGLAVSVSIAGATYTVTANSSGVWSVDTGTATPSSGTLAINANGSNAVSATATDASGNSSTPATQTLVIDTTAPAANLSTATDNVGSVTGNLNSGNITDDTALALSGTCEAGSTVKVYNGSTLLGTATVSGTTWSYSATVADGTTYQFSVKETDAAGNTSAATSNFTVIGDTTAPTQTVGSVDISDDSGGSANDFNTNASAQTITATLSAPLATGDTLYGSVDNGATWVDISNKVTGTAISWDGATLSGSSNILFKLSDAAGNTGASTGSTAYVLDTTAPTANLSTANDDAGTVTGNLSSGDTTDDTALTLSGTCEAGSTVQVYDGSTLLGTATVTGTTWSYSASVADASTYQFKVTETDAAGNTSAATSGFSVIGDTTAPAIHVTGDASPAPTNDPTPTVSGTAEADATVSVVIAGATYTVTADSSGAWSVDTATATPTSGTLSLNTNGNNNITAIATDAAGNTSKTFGQTLSIDTTAPTLAITSPISGGYISDTEDEATLSISGTSTGTVGRSVTVLVGGVGGISKSAVIAGDGSWSIDLSSTELKGLSAGTVSITADVSDAAGNAATQANASYVYDHTAPTQTVNAVDISDDSGSDAADFLTKTPNQTISGTLSTVLAAGDILYGSVDNGTTWTDITSKVSASTITWTGATLSGNGNTGILFKVSDAAGNDSASSGSTAYVLDTAPPSIHITGDASAATNVATPTVSGTTDANTTVSVVIAGATYTVTADSSGAWSVNTATATPTSGTLSLNTNGSNSITATATDAAGNSSKVFGQTLTIDSIAPTIAIPATALSNDATPTVSGTAEAGATVAVTIGGATYTVTANGSGNWSVDTSSTPTSGTLAVNVNGSNTVSATATDAAGNSSSPVNQTLTIDTTAPTTTVTIDSISSDSGTADFITNDNNGLTINATLSAALASDETLQYSRDNGATWSTVASSSITSGTVVSFADSTLTSTNTIQFRVVDPAGNAAAATSQLVTIDTTGPSAPSAPDLAADDDTGTGAGTSDNSTTNTSGLTFSGTAETGSSVELFKDTDNDGLVDAGESLGTATATGGNWSIDATLTVGGPYHVKAIATDAAGNLGTASAATDVTVTSAVNILTNIVVFDLVEGVSSSHSNRTFASNVTYTIYIRVNSNSASLSTDSTGPGPADTWGTWTGSNNLTGEDRIVLVGSGAPVKGSNGNNVAGVTPSMGTIFYKTGSTSQNAATFRGGSGKFVRKHNYGTNSVFLWNGNWGGNPNNGSALANVYKTAMPAGILTSQGLA